MLKRKYWREESATLVKGGWWASETDECTDLSLECPGNGASYACLPNTCTRREESIQRAELVRAGLEKNRFEHRLHVYLILL